MPKENYKVLEKYQELVDDVLLRHRSVLDVMARFQQFNSRMTRAIARAATDCGCIRICAEKQDFGEDTKTFEDKLSTHVSGTLCPRCKEVLLKEAGDELYYFTSLLNIFQISLSEVMDNEIDHMETLGKYMLK